MFADQGYLSKLLLLRLWQRDLHWVTGIGRSKKNYLLPLLDKVLLRKRYIIETLFAKLKSSMGLEHTRHRWPVNALVHILSYLAATTLAQPKVNIGNIAIPSPISTIPSVSSPYPELGFCQPAGHQREGFRSMLLPLCSRDFALAAGGSEPDCPGHPPMGRLSSSDCRGSGQWTGVESPFCPSGFLCAETTVPSMVP